jgi:hypothetical protein
MYSYYILLVVSDITFNLILHQANFWISGLISKMQNSFIVFYCNTQLILVRLLHKNLLKASLDRVINWHASLQTIVAYLGIKLVKAISPKLPPYPI